MYGVFIFILNAYFVNGLYASALHNVNTNLSSAQLGDDITFKCSDNPIWYHKIMPSVLDFNEIYDDIYVFGKYKILNTNAANDNLILRNLSYSDNGMYVCCTTNGINVFILSVFNGNTNIVTVTTNVLTCNYHSVNNRRWLFRYSRNTLYEYISYDDIITFNYLSSYSLINGNLRTDIPGYYTCLYTVNSQMVIINYLLHTN